MPLPTTKIYTSKSQSGWINRMVFGSALLAAFAAQEQDLWRPDPHLLFRESEWRRVYDSTHVRHRRDLVMASTLVTWTSTPSPWTVPAGVSKLDEYLGVAGGGSGGIHGAPDSSSTYILLIPSPVNAIEWGGNYITATLPANQQISSYSGTSQTGDAYAWQVANLGTNGSNIALNANNATGAFSVGILSNVAGVAWNVATSTLNVAGSIGKWVLQPLASFFTNAASATVTITWQQAMAAFFPGTTNLPALSAVIGDEINWSIGGLNLTGLTTASKIWLTVKPLTAFADVIDANSMLQLQQTQGLLVVNSTAASNASQGSLALNASGGTIDVTLDSAASNLLKPGTFSVGIRAEVDSTPNAKTLGVGTVNFMASITQAF